MRRIMMISLGFFFVKMSLSAAVLQGRVIDLETAQPKSGFALQINHQNVQTDGSGFYSAESEKDLFLLRFKTALQDEILFLTQKPILHLGIHGQVQSPPTEANGFFDLQIHWSDQQISSNAQILLLGMNAEKESFRIMLPARPNQHTLPNLPYVQKLFLIISTFDQAWVQEIPIKPFQNVDFAAETNFGDPLQTQYLAFENQGNKVVIPYFFSADQKVRASTGLAPLYIQATPDFVVRSKHPELLWPKWNFQKTSSSFEAQAPENLQAYFVIELVSATQRLRVISDQAEFKFQLADFPGFKWRSTRFYFFKEPMPFWDENSLEQADWIGEFR